jgi:hypothetical protein
LRNALLFPVFSHPFGCGRVLSWRIPLPKVWEGERRGCVIRLKPACRLHRLAEALDASDVVQFFWVRVGHNPVARMLIDGSPNGVKPTHH